MRGLGLMNVLMQDFVNYLEHDRGVSANTLQSYSRDIRQFSDYIDARNIDVTKTTKNDVAMYVAYMQKNGKRRRRYHARLPR